MNILVKNKAKFSSLVEIFILGLGFIFCSSVLAQGKQKVSFDIYRTNQVSAKDIEKKFGKQISEVSRLMNQMVDGKAKAGTDKKIDQNISKITSGIYSMGDFEFVKIVPIAYPSEGIHITIDIVDKKDKHRISVYSSFPNKNLPDPDHLIQKWEEYMDKGFKITYQKKRAYKPTPCPAHHCIYGFDENELKPYKNIFNTLVPKNKHKLIQILREDKNEDKRASSVFLLAHLKEKKEVARILVPSFSDPSVLVRNNLMRVFSNLIGKEKIDFPVGKIVSALDAPFLQERNKALLIMNALAKNPEHSDYIKQHAAPLLLANLKMIQPNLHYSAYVVLKKISGKDFGERDYKAWELWVKSLQQKRKNVEYFY